MGDLTPSTPLETHPESLPIIDISPFLDQSSSPEALKATTDAINQACTNYGFFYVTGHGIPVSTLDKVISLAREFFALPLEKKNQIKRYEAGGPEGGDGARGYQGMGENITGGKRDVQEAVDFYREWKDSGLDHTVDKDEEERRNLKEDGKKSYKTLQGPNLWPEEPKELKDVYLSYIAQCQQIGKALVLAMGMALNLGESIPGPQGDPEDQEIFVRSTNKSFWVLRMIGYPKLETPLTPSADPSEFSCGEHTDYGCVTLLLSDPTPGALQVLSKSGAWIPANPLPGAFVVNIGDMIERWTNGLWKSTRHRVIHRGDGYRVSVPFFYEPNFEAVVRPLGKCVAVTGEKEGYERGRYGEHLLGKVFGNFYNDP